MRNADDTGYAHDATNGYMYANTSLSYLKPVRRFLVILSVWYGLVWLGTAGYGWVWLGMAGYGWVWLGMVGYGWVWLGMVGIVFSSSFHWYSIHCSIIYITHIQRNSRSPYVVSRIG